MRWPTLGACRTQTIGDDEAQMYGFQITPGTGSKGSWTSLPSTPAFDWHHLSFVVNWDWAQGDVLVDLGIDDGAGNTFILAPDLRNSAIVTTICGCHHSLPLYVPAGATLKVRAQAADVWGVFVTLHGFSRGLGGAAGFPRCYALTTPSSRRGVVIDAGGSANTKSSWTQLTASTAGPIQAISLSIDQAGDTARSLCGWLVDIGIGGAGSEQVVVPNLFLSAEATLDLVTPTAFGPLPVDIPSGTRVAARAQCSITTSGDRTFGLNAWGFGP